MFGLFTPRVDHNCLQNGGEKAGRILVDSLEAGCSLYEISRTEFAEAVRRHTDCQLMVVAMTSAICGYTLQDAYYDAGLAGPLSGMPKVKFNVRTDGRAMAQAAWSQFPPCKADLDMRYRIVFSRQLSVPEAGLWERCEDWASAAARSKFEYQQQLSPGWIRFVHDISSGDVAGAKQLLKSLPS